MKFELKRLADYSDEAILKEIRRVAKVIRSPKISTREFRDHSCVHWSTVQRRFGSWEKALIAAGLADRFDASNKAVSRDMVISELQRVSKLLGGQVFNSQQFNDNADFTDAVARRIFGTWHKAMQAAGLITNALGKRYTEDECFENLLQVWTYYGRPPMHREMSQAPSMVGPKAYTLRWGTWNKALHAFVQRVNEDMQSAPTESIVAQANSFVKAAKSETDECDRRDIRLGLRYTVLSRDRFKCVLCGSSPATSLDCQLQVDHKIPFSKGGKTEITNLRTLCQSCNLGKSAKIEEGVAP